MLKTKIPPPVIACLFIVLLYISSFFMSEFQLEGQSYLAFFIFIISLGLIISASLEFKRFKTTVNPLNPETASHLVVGGIYKHTRNPMYIALSAVILAFGIYYGTWLVVILLPLFIVCINYLQIFPEEAAMKKLFGEEYITYCNSVRRWL